METQSIFIYCLADAIVRAIGLKDDSQSKMSHAEVITFVILSALHYQCNYKSTRLISLNSRLFSHVLSHSRIVRRIHNIPEAVWLMVFLICRDFFHNHSSQEYIVDSFPVAVCQNYKRFRCKLFQGKKFHGYTASKKQYFFGIKVHMIIDTHGVPIEFVFTPGAESDIRGFNRLNIELPKGAILYGDRAYTDYALEDFLKTELDMTLLAKRKKNSRRQHNAYDELRISLTRNKVETAFSSISSLMPRCIRARTERGFCLKVMFFILGYTIKASVKNIHP